MKINKYRYWKLLLICICILPTRLIYSQQSNNISLRGQIGGGYINNFAVKHDYLFCGVGTLLKIFDFNNSVNPKQVANIPFTDLIKDIFTEDNYLFVANNSNGLIIFSLDSINNPRKVCEINPEANVIGGKIINGLLSIYLENNGFIIFDITDINKPKEILKWIAAPNVKDIEQIGDYLFVADYGYGLRIIDIQTIDSPKQINQLFTTGYRGVYEIEIKNNIAYIGRNNNISVINIEIPSAPVFVKDFEYDTPVSDFIFENNLAYIAKHGYGLEILDISDPLYPVSISRSPITRGTLDFSNIVKSSKFVYAIENGRAFSVIDVTDISNIKEVYLFKNENGYMLSTIHKNYLLLDGIKKIFDISNPSNPIEVYKTDKSFTFSNYPASHKATVDDSSVYLGCEEGLFIWSLEDISNPKLSCNIRMQDPMQLYLHNNYLISSGFGESNIIDIRDVEKPFFVARIKYESIANSIKINDNFIYLATSIGKILILDISLPTLPKLVQTIEGYNFRDIQIVNNILYGIVYPGSLILYDISNPYSPVKLNDIYLFDDMFLHISIENNYAYILGSSSISVLDVTEPLYPIVVGIYNFSGDLQFPTLYVKNGLISVVSRSHGIFLLSFNEFTDAKNMPVHSYFSLLQNYPNPFNPSTTIQYSVPKHSFVNLKVYDILGKEVAILVNEEKSPGNYRVNFNASGLSSGLYFYRIQAGDFVEVKKMILAK